MKKSYFLVVTVVIMFFSFSIYAQQFGTRGCVEIGGTISYSNLTMVSNGEVDSESSSMFNFLPALNYFVADHFAIGISPGVNIFKMAGADESITNLMLFGVAGYTFTTRGNVFPFIEGMIGYTSIYQEESKENGFGDYDDDFGFDMGGHELDLSGISYGARGGIRVLVGKSGLANISVSYMMFTFNPKDADKRNGLNTLSVNVGFSVFLGK